MVACYIAAMVAPVSPFDLPPAALPVALVTGFDAFDSHADNPSWLLAQRLDGRQLAGHRVVAAQLPTCFGLSWQRLHALLERWQPALVLCLGLAAQRQALSVERVAINVDDARIPDNAGAQPLDEPVVAGAPAAYFSTLPIKAMVQAAAATGLAAEVSQTAGTFVCNHIFYALMHHLGHTPGCAGMRGGFVHVPLANDAAGLGLDAQERGLAAALSAALSQRQDERITGGALE